MKADFVEPAQRLTFCHTETSVKNGLIYHLFPGNMEHHTPTMIRFFLNNHSHWNHDRNAYRFVVFGSRDENKSKYDIIELNAGQIIQLPPSTRSLMRWLRGLAKGDQLVMHSAFMSKIWAMLLLNPRLWRRTAWVMWGADILKRPSIKGRIYARIKRIVIPRLGAVSALVPGEYNLLKSLYGPADNYVRAFYPIKVEINNTDAELDKIGLTRPLRVLLGNSAWDANNHEEALRWLSRFANEDIEIVCPLGYPAESEYKTKVISLGENLLERKFVAIREMLDNIEFWKLAGSCDLLILNNLNQQGLASVYFMLFQGKKIYLRPENPTFQMMKDFGIEAYSSLDLAHISFKEFANYREEIVQRNLNQAEEHLSPNASIRGWRDLFHRLSPKTVSKRKLIECAKL